MAGAGLLEGSKKQHLARSAWNEKLGFESVRSGVLSGLGSELGIGELIFLEVGAFAVQA